MKLPAAVVCKKHFRRQRASCDEENDSYTEICDDYFLLVLLRVWDLDLRCQKYEKAEREQEPLVYYDKPDFRETASPSGS